MDKSYNGYTNKETWAMALYLDDCIDWAADCESAKELEETLRYIFTEELIEEVDEPFYALLKTALAKVDWKQLAEVLFEDYNEEE